jgi:mRNA-degrading endonuclease RelE of RelBE toxin-antitoxin system
MASIEWTDPAFAQLEALSEKLAFEIVRRVDVLATFPEMGVPRKSQYPALRNCRQLIIKRSYRVIYEFDRTTDIVYIFVVQHCRQPFPPASKLRRPPEEAQ